MRILIPKEEWYPSPLSIARHYGGININGIPYILVRTDLVHQDYVSICKRVGRDKLIDWERQGLTLEEMKLRIKGARDGEEQDPNQLTLGL